MNTEKIVGFTDNDQEVTISLTIPEDDTLLCHLEMYAPGDPQTTLILSCNKEKMYSIFDRFIYEIK